MNNIRTIQANKGWFRRKFSVNESYFEDLGQEQAWLIGLLAADGNVSGNYLRLSQSGPDGYRLLMIIKDMLQYTGRLYVDKEGQEHRLVITSKALVKCLRSYGIVERKSLIYEFPIGTLPIELYPAFLRGYVEGDGCAGIYWTGTTSMLTINFVGTEQFIDVCCEIIPVRGICTKINRAANCVELRFNGQKAIELGYWIWKDKNLPLTPKRAIWEGFITGHRPKYLAYAKNKLQVTRMLDQKIPVSEIAFITDIPFQTIYKWRSLHRSKGLLSNLMLCVIDYIDEASPLL